MKRNRPTNAEQRRLDAQRAGTEDWRLWGPYLAERAWGTVREDYSADGDAWSYFHPRPSPLARLSLERGRARRDLRRTPAVVLCPGAVERARPDPQGARLRSRRERGQPRRGREGILLLSRRDPEPQLDALPLQIPARPIPLRPARRRKPPAQPARSAVQPPRHRGLRRGALLGCRDRLRKGLPERDPHPHRGAQPRPRAGDDPPAAEPVVPQHLVLVGAGREAPPLRRRRAVRGRLGGPRRACRPRPLPPLRRSAGRAAVHRERNQYRAPLGRGERGALCEGRVPSPRRRRRYGSGQPRAHRDQICRVACPRGGARPIGAHRSGAVGRGSFRPLRPQPRRFSPCAGRKPTPFSARCCRRGAPTTIGCSGKPCRA